MRLNYNKNPGEVTPGFSLCQVSVLKGKKWPKLENFLRMFPNEKIMEKYKKMKKSACIFRKAII